MYKKIILLTKSRKFNNYCIAGIDCDTQQWVRLISNDSSIHNAVEPKDIQYEDGEEAKVLDIVKVEYIGEEINYYQPENILFDDEFYWLKTGEATVENLESINNSDKDRYIFYNNAKKVSKEHIEDIEINKRYSLKLIEPLMTTIYVKTWNINEGSKVTAEFLYNDEWYSYIPITDEHFRAEYAKKGDGGYSLNNVYFVMSLADLYDGYHYKLIASVIYK